MQRKRANIVIVQKINPRFKGLSIRFRWDRITGEPSLVCIWPGGMLLIGIAHPVPELQSTD